MTRSIFTFVLLAGAGALASGCADAGVTEPQPEGAAPSALHGGDSAQAGAAKAPGTAVAQLLATMEGVGPDAQRRYQEALRGFLASPQPMGALETHYASLPLEARAARWKTVYAMGKLPMPEAVGLLEQIAVGHMKPAPSAAKAAPTGEEDVTDQPIEREAATAIAVRAVAGESLAAKALTNVLVQSDAEVARAAAIELFAAGRLEPGHRALLDQRGIKSNFRRLAQNEEAALFRLDPTMRSNARKPMINPPALEVSP